MAETSGLLNRRTGISRTEGSNPSVSASSSTLSIWPFKGAAAAEELPYVRGWLDKLPLSPEAIVLVGEHATVRGSGTCVTGW